MMVSTIFYAMLSLALNNTIVAAATMSPMRPVKTLALIPIKALLSHKPSLAFYMLPAKTSNMRLSPSKSLMVSTSSDTELSCPPREKQTTATGRSLHTVMVRRNRQSAAFREGTPLIFGGSVAATFTEYFLDDSSTSVGADTIPMGSLVAVVVSRDFSSKTQEKKGSRERRGKSNSDRKKIEAISHHTSFNADDLETKHRETIKKSQLIGYGVFNPESMYRVRILCHATMHPGLTKEVSSIRKGLQRGSDQSEDSSLKLILERKMSDAINTRRAMNLPLGGVTDTYRLINGEGDGLSGLAVDVLGGSAVIVMSSAAWCEIHKDTIVTVLERSLSEHPSYEGADLDIAWRNTPSRLKQDGYELISKSSEGGEDEKGAVSVVSTESSVKYLTYPFSDGQKTGFYADQRENRLMVAELCQNKRVLDLCCYNGGFALNAMFRGNAASAIGIDSSQDAVDASVANAKLNGLAQKDISFVRDDISSFMKRAIEVGDEFDVIVLDPPKLAPSVSSLEKASRKYHALNRDAMNLIDKSRGGLLLTCTCSAAMTQKDGGQYFLSMVNGAALSARRRVTLVGLSGAAPCHTQSPASFPAGAYLTAALFHVGPTDM